MNRPVPAPMRQSVWALAFIVWHYARVMVRQWWPLFLVAFLRPADRRTVFGGWITAGFLFVLLISSLLDHFFFSFWLDDTTLHVREGWLHRKRKSIPLDRIQSLNLEQTLLHRLTRTAKVLVETAGSAKPELEIRALGLDRVAWIRTRIFGTGNTGGQPRETIPQPPTADQELFQLSALDLIKTGLSQNHLRTIGVVLLVLAGFLDDLQNQWGLIPDDWWSSWGDALSSLASLSVLLVLLGIGVVMASVIRIVVTHADLALFFNGRGFRIHAGLITIRETAISLRKLQTVTWRQIPLQRLFGLYSLEFAQAASEDPGRKAHVQVPGLTGAQLRMVLDRVFREEDHGPGAWSGVHPGLAWWRWLTIGWLPSMAGLAAGFLIGPVFWMISGFWIVGATIWSHRWTQRWQWFLNRDLLILRTGWLSLRTTLLPLYRIQSVALSRSPVQARYGVVTVFLNTAGGTLRLPWLPDADADRLKRYLLYRVESDDRSWM